MVTRALTSSVLVLVVFALVLASWPVRPAAETEQQIKNRTRFTPGTAEHPGRVNWGAYFAIPDPKAAAKLLSKKAPLAGHDMTAIGKDIRGTAVIDLPGQRLVRAERARAFVDSLKHCDNGTIAGYTVCLIKFARQQSAHDMVALLSRGVRVYQAWNGSACIARLATKDIPGVAALDFVEWLQPYLPEFKLSPAEVFKDANNHILVYSFRMGTSLRFAPISFKRA